MYDSIFGEECPRFSCKMRLSLMKASLKAGYRKRCRNPRCSLECLHRWAEKEKWIMGYFLENLPKEFNTYRGNLKCVEGSSVDDHRQIRKNFLRGLKAYCGEYHHVIKFRAYTHITSITEAHYDVVIWSDLGTRRMRDVVADCWRAAGGLRSSINSLSDEEEQRWSAYVTKARPKKDAFRFRYMPAHNGLPLTWGTRGFWNGRTHNQVWVDWLKATFHIEKTIKLKDMSGLVQLSITKLCLPEALSAWRFQVPESDRMFYQSDEETLSAWADAYVSKYPDIAVIQSPITYTQANYDMELKGLPTALQTDLLNIIPTDKTNTIGANTIAAKLSLPVEEVKAALGNLKGVHCCQGEMDGEGNYVYNGYWRSA